MDLYRYYEIKAKELIEEKGSLVEDVSNNPDYWIKDIDLVVKRKDGTTYTVEVKCDTRIGLTGNLFLEYENKCQLGWFSYTKADYLFYGDARNRKFYIFDLQPMRDFVFKNKLKWQTKWVGERYNDNLKSFGYIVPIYYLRQFLIEEVEI